MSRRVVITVFFLLFVAIVMPIGADAQGGNRVYYFETTGPLPPTRVEYLERGIELAERENGKALTLQIGGLKVNANDERVLDTENVCLVEVPQSFIEQFIQILTNPNIVFLLLSIGIQAILIEIPSPGGWIAGFVGVVCLALGTYGLGVLPVNWFGLIFILTSFVLFILEIKAPTHGALSLAGMSSFIVGFLILFNSPTTPSFLHVSVPLVVGMGVAIAISYLAVLSLFARIQFQPVEVGPETLIGRTAEARSNISPRGTVQVSGELWSAVLENSEDVIRSGETVDIIGVEGIRLRVRPWKNGS